MRIKPKCEKCNRLYLGGRDGSCKFCLKGASRRNKIKPLHCLCGKLAYVVLLAEVFNPEGEFIQVELPLCKACRQLELDLESAEARQPPGEVLNPIRVIVGGVRPHPPPKMSGRKF